MTSSLGTAAWKAVGTCKPELNWLASEKKLEGQLCPTRNCWQSPPQYEPSRQVPYLSHHLPGLHCSSVLKISWDVALLTSLEGPPMPCPVAVPYTWPLISRFRQSLILETNCIWPLRVPYISPSGHMSDSHSCLGLQHDVPGHLQNRHEQEPSAYHSVTRSRYPGQFIGCG